MSNKRKPVMLYKVKLFGIQWETDGHSADKLGLPKNFETEVEAEDTEAAAEISVDEASENYGWLINGVTDEEITPI